MPEALILLANVARDGPGEAVPAGTLTPGVDWVWSPHERTGKWGAWPVTHKRKIESDIWAVLDWPETSPSHLWRIGEGWTRMDQIGSATGRTGTVVAITIGEAHTYVLVGPRGEWLVSHNKLAEGE